jgi:TolB protein
LSNGISRLLPSPVQLTFLTNRTPSVSSPDWSPDGEFIAYGVAGEFSAQVFIMPASGGTPVAYTPATSFARSPSWSPNGNQLAITLDDSTLAVMNAQPIAPAEVLAGHAPLWVSWPRWAPDGMRIFYIVRDVFQPTVNSELLVLALGGGSPELLSNESRHSGLDVSPDGSQLVYGSNAAGTYDLWAMPSSGGMATRLTSDPGRERNPAWSPDGTRIAYEDGEEIWVIDSTGENPTRVTFFGSAYAPFARITWSPDGSAIAFSIVDRASSASNIWRMQVR